MEGSGLRSKGEVPWNPDLSAALDMTGIVGQACPTIVNRWAEAYPAKTKYLRESHEEELYFDPNLLGSIYHWCVRRKPRETSTNKN